MLKEILQEHENNLETKISELNNVQKETFNESLNYTLNNQMLDNSNMDISAGCICTYDGRFQDALKEYTFPTIVKLKDGLIFQLHSNNMNHTRSTKIKPF